MSSTEVKSPIPLIEIEGNDSLKANPLALECLKALNPEYKVSNLTLQSYLAPYLI